jgi:phospholipid transport system transporter-binding protein
VKDGATRLSIEPVGAGRLTVSGRLGFGNAAAALPRLAAATGSGDAIAIDLAGLDDADSATLAVLLALAAHATQRGARLDYRNIPEDLRALARLAEVESLPGFS